MSATQIDIPALLDRQKIGWFHVVLVALCGAGAMMDGLDLQTIGYVAPAISKAWALQPGALGPVFGGGLFGMAIGATCFGILGDRIGRKFIMIACVAVFGAATLLTSTSGSMTSLLVWRFITGLGVGGIMPNMMVLVTEYAPQRARATLMMLVSTCFPIGVAFGGWLAAWLLPRWGWQAVFLAAGALTLLLVPLLIVALPESLRRLVLRQVEENRIRAILRRVNPALIVPAGARFTASSETAKRAHVSEIFRERRALTTICLSSVLFMNMMSLYFLNNWLPTMLNNAGFTVQTAVVVTSFFALGGTIGTVLLGILADRIHPATILTAVFLTASTLVASIAISGAPYYAIVALVFVTGFCINGAQFVSIFLSSISYPTAIRSTGVGWALGTGRLGAVAGPMIAGLFLSWSWSAPSIFLASAVPPLVGALAALTLRYRARRRAMLLHATPERVTA